MELHYLERFHTFPLHKITLTTRTTPVQKCELVFIRDRVKLISFNFLFNKGFLG